MKILKKTVYILFIALLGGCVTINDARQGDKKWSPEFTIQGGFNSGGIVENTDMTEMDGVSVDAFSGATRTGVNVGAHVKAPLVFNYVETGIDYMYNNQTFTYLDALNGFTGDRQVGVSQLMVPVTYNFTFLKKKREGGLFQLKLGVLIQYNSLNVADRQPGLPEYDYQNFSNGMVMGFETIPFDLNNGARLGFYGDLYRGTRIYEDFYNQRSFDIPGSSFFKAGVIYHFNK